MPRIWQVHVPIHFTIYVEQIQVKIHVEQIYNTFQCISCQGFNKFRSPHSFQNCNFCFETTPCYWQKTFWGSYKPIENFPKIAKLSYIISANSVLPQPKLMMQSLQFFFNISWSVNVLSKLFHKNLPSQRKVKDVQLLAEYWGGTLVLARTEGRGLLSVRKTRTKISGQFLKCEDWGVRIEDMH